MERQLQQQMQELQVQRDQLQQQLPAGWAIHKDAASGRAYYHNAGTGVSQWEVPKEVSSHGVRIMLVAQCAGMLL